MAAGRALRIRRRCGLRALTRAARAVRRSSIRRFLKMPTAPFGLGEIGPTAPTDGGKTSTDLGLGSCRVQCLGGDHARAWPLCCAPQTVSEDPGVPTLCPLRADAKTGSAAVDAFKDYRVTLLAPYDDCQCKYRLFRSIIVFDWRTASGFRCCAGGP
jgi:hypothetical protein